MAFLDADHFKRSNTFCDQRSTDAQLTVIGMNSQMVEIAPPAVMSAQNSSNDLILVSGDKTHPRISSKVGFDTVFGIRTAEADTLATFPKRNDVLIICYRKLKNVYLHVYVHRYFYIAAMWVVVTSAKSRPALPVTRVRTTFTRLPLRTNRASALICPSR